MRRSPKDVRLLALSVRGRVRRIFRRRARLSYVAVSARAPSFLTWVMLVTVFAHSAASCGDQPFSGAFALEGHEYSLGEPILVVFTAVNCSDEKSAFFVRDTPSYGFRFSAVDGVGRKVEGGRGAYQGGMYVANDVAPGGTYRQTVLLSRYLEIAQPGTYTLDCAFDITPVAVVGGRRVEGRTTSVRQQMQLRITPFDVERVRAAADRLVELLSRGGPEEGQVAIDALAKLPAEVRVQYMQRALERSSGDYVSGVALRVLGEANTDEAVRTIRQALHSGKPWVRGCAALALGEISATRGDYASLEELAPLCHDDDPRVRRDAGRAIARIGGARAITLLAQMATDPSVAVRHWVAVGLGSTGSWDGEVREALRTLAHDEAPRARLGAAMAIRRISAKGNRAAGEALQEMLSDPDASVRFYVSGALRGATEAAAELSLEPHAIALGNNEVGSGGQESSDIATSGKDTGSGGPTSEVLSVHGGTEEGLVRTEQPGTASPSDAASQMAYLAFGTAGGIVIGATGAWLLRRRRSGCAAP